MPNEPTEAVRIPPPLKYDYDETTDTLTVSGVKYTGDLFRAFATAKPDWTSQAFRYRRREADGRVELQVLRDDVCLNDLRVEEIADAD